MNALLLGTRLPLARAPALTALVLLSLETLQGDKAEVAKATGISKANAK